MRSRPRWRCTLGRLGEPGDVARAIVFLLDPENDWITGQVLGVDGGLGSLKSAQPGANSPGPSWQTMTHAALIYPPQLFADHPTLADASQVVMVEEPRFFTQYVFHRQKLMLHRATMKQFANVLRGRNLKVHYVEACELPDTAALVGVLKRLRITSVRYVDPCDDLLSTRLAAALGRGKIKAIVLEDTHFLTSLSVIRDFVGGKRRLFFTDFYIAQRKRLGLLLDEPANRPAVSGALTLANRKRLPKGVARADSGSTRGGESIREAREYVRQRFPHAVGSDEGFSYPTDHAGAAAWLDTFVHERLPSFGDYEDAMSTAQDVLFHSVLTPMLNIGLISPRQVIEAALAQSHRIPLNSLEGFIRQVIGWREFVRLVYLTHGRVQRARNFWGFARPLPAAFYDGTTGMAPVDHVIRKVLRNGYCHHIERLMILGNFMLLCELDPDAVYRWFMELFIDAYDWVMVPNVYGMSQYADGGFMTTKPYISGSSYVRKMSDFKKGAWCGVWDALFLAIHRSSRPFLRGESPHGRDGEDKRQAR